jgi:hypothetical protein
MASLHFEGLSDEVHHCTSFRSGDTIVWKCPHCIGYERKLNLMTGEMSVKGKTGYSHTGFNEGKENMEGLTHNISKQ